MGSGGTDVYVGNVTKNEIGNLGKTFHESFFVLLICAVLLKIFFM